MTDSYGGDEKLYDYVPMSNALSSNVHLADQSQGCVDNAIASLRRCNDVRSQTSFMDEIKNLASHVPMLTAKGCEMYCASWRGMIQPSVEAPSVEACFRAKGMK